MPNANSQMADTILVALLTTASVTDAAGAAGVARSTVYDYLNDEAFIERLSAARRDLEARIADSVVDKAAHSVAVAIDTLTKYAGCDYGFMQSSEDALKASEIIMRSYGGGVMREVLKRNMQACENGTEESI